MLKLNQDSIIYISNFLGFGDLTDKFLHLNKAVYKQTKNHIRIVKRKKRIQEIILKICLYHSKQILDKINLTELTNTVLCDTLDNIYKNNNVKSQCEELILFLETLTKTNIFPETSTIPILESLDYISYRIVNLR
tara:strand:- start:8054 stop:8458 length:405 start_codon:yes stop_codon:yes gene_type:complete